MTSPELEELFNKEVDRRVTEILSVWVEKISSTHRGIDIEVLLRDLPESVSDSHFSKGRCRGVIKGGARCSRLGKNGGYCGFHLNQKKKIAKKWKICDGEITWLDSTASPTKEEVQAKVDEMNAAEPLRHLRAQRNLKLKETD